MLCRQTGAFLLPFALTAPLGVGIGVALSDVNPWAQMVLYALATGFFIYVGACEVMSHTIKVMILKASRLPAWHAEVCP